MANISKRPSSNYRVQIRQKGQAPLSRTFPTLARAEAFVEEMEHASKNLVLKDALIKYELAVTPTKKSADQERYRIGQWLPAC